MCALTVASLSLVRFVDGPMRPGQDEGREPLVGSLPGNAQRLSDRRPCVASLDRVSDHDDEPFIGLIAKITNKPDGVWRLVQPGAAGFSELLHGDC